TKVIRPAARRVALEDGRAKVTVAAFHGDLPIDVEIAGGRRAHGVAHAGGPLAVKLTTTKGSAARPHVSPPKAAPRASKELQESPYK
ncbi:MAG: hypothetical protein KIS78_26400, partial [Labilithrix sp.]|nr:hypothetical protein [Labilithrix sp.]